MYSNFSHIRAVICAPQLEPSLSRALALVLHAPPLPQVEVDADHLVGVAGDLAPAVLKAIQAEEAEDLGLTNVLKNTILITMVGQKVVHFRALEKSCSANHCGKDSK